MQQHVAQQEQARHPRVYLYTGCNITLCTQQGQLENLHAKKLANTISTSQPTVHTDDTEAELLLTQVENQNSSLCCFCRARVMQPASHGQAVSHKQR